MFFFYYSLSFSLSLSLSLSITVCFSFSSLCLSLSLSLPPSISPHASPPSIVPPAIPPPTPHSNCSSAPTWFLPVRYTTRPPTLSEGVGGIGKAEVVTGDQFWSLVRSARRRKQEIPSLIKYSQFG